MLEQQPVSDIRLSTRHGNHAIETEVEDAAFDFRHGTPGADEELVAVGLGLFASDSGRFGYDVVFVGSPCWWGTVAPPVATFLAAYDWSGKTVAPFMTHGGSRMGRSEDDIEKLCPGATLLGGLPVRGSAVKGSRDAVGKRIGGMNLSK